MPIRPSLRSCLAAWLLATPCLIAPCLLAGPHGGARAQSASDADAEREATEAAQKAQAKADAKAAAPPPAIPGAVTDEATATSGHASVDMEPTAALFDAINRGDIVSAKEALGRGADLEGKNVLGQSPLDMSIDLNRSDITFLLLSMRNSESGPPAASVQTADADADDQATTARTASAGGKTRSPRAERVATREKPTVRQVADGGTPQPELGFLGFGGS